MPIPSWWLLLSSGLPRLADAGFSDLPKSQIDQLPFSCILPVEEDADLFNTTIGQALWTGSVNLRSTLPGAAREAAFDYCNNSVIPPGEPPDAANRTRAEYVRVCTDSLSYRLLNLTIDALTECNQTKVAELCDRTEPGNFCFKAVSTDEAEQCVLTRKIDGVKQAVQTECMEGFYCVGGQADPRVCQKGKYCPEASPAARDCEPGHTCIFANAQLACTSDSDPMLTGTNCAQDDEKRILLPDVCKSMHYCVGGEMFPCEEGHFCPDGAGHQHICGRWEFCPAGSYFPGRTVPSIIYTGANIVQLVAVTLAFNENFCGAHWQLHGLFLCVWFVIFMVTESANEDGGGLPEHVSFLVLYTWGAIWVAVLSPALGTRLTGIEGTGIKSIVANLIAMGAGFFSVYSLDGSWYGVLFLGILVPAFFLTKYAMTDSDSFVWIQVTLFVFAILGLIALTIASQPSFGLSAIMTGLVMMIPLLFSPLFSTLNVLLKLKRQGGLQEVEKNLVRTSSTSSEKPMATLDSRRSKLKAEILRRENSKVSRVNSNLSRGNSKLSKVTHGNSQPKADVLSLSQPLKVVGSEFEMGNIVQKVSTGADEDSMDMERNDERPPAIGLTLRDMSLLLRSGKSILDKINLSIPPSSACAVMGPSGSGKSSITNVLSGRAGYGVILGDILVNGKDDIPLKDLRGVTGFVPQDDVMNRELTCMENVAFQAKMRLPVASRQGGLKWADKQASVILKNFGLAQVKNSKIGDEQTRGISGGQRKRVSIAMEFICQPSLLFLDEPTTGLDSTTSHRVVELVTAYAHEMNCTTTAVVHQPRFETLMLFDYVILLATGGYLTYAGPTKDVVRYFKTGLGVPFALQANPADILMDAMSLDSAKELAEHGKMSCPDPGHLQDTTSFGMWLSSVWAAHADQYTPPEQNDVDFPLPDLYPVLSNTGELVIVQVRRAALQLQRSVTHNLSMAALLGVGTWVIATAIPAQRYMMQFFFHLSIALLFFMLSQGVAAQRSFGGAERVVAWREAGVNVKMPLYFMGRDVISLVEVMMGATVFTFVYWMKGPLFMDFRQLFWASFAFNYAAFGYGFLWSILLDSATAQMVAISTSFMFFFLSGMQPGFATLVQVGDGMLVYFMSLSPVRWAHGYLSYTHIVASEGSQFSNPLIYLEQAFLLEGYGIVVGEEFAKVCTSEGPPNVLTRWLGDSEQKPMAYNCSTQQLFLLGIFLRFVCALALSATSKIQSTGGGALFEGRTRGLFAELTGPVLNLVFWAFLIVLTTCAISLLLMTK